MTTGAETMDGKATTTKSDELRQQARVVGEDLKRLGSIAKDATREGLTAARERAAETYGSVRERGGEVGEALTTHIEKHPWQSVAIAAGIGAFLGILLSRRH